MEQIYSKADELQSAVREKQAQGKKSDSEQKKLLRVKELFRAYEEIAEATVRVVHSDRKIRRDTEIGMISLYLF